MASPTEPAGTDSGRHLALAFVTSDAGLRLAARRGARLDVASAVSRALDLRRARAKAEPSGDASRAALDAAHRRLAIARNEDERSHVDPLDPPDHIAVLHGRIHGADGVGISGLAVRALGADGKPRGESKTGDRGYFRIEVPAERQPGRLPTIEASSTATATAPLTRIALRLAVADGRRELHVEKGTTLVRPSRAVYREIEVATAPR